MRADDYMLFDLDLVDGILQVYPVPGDLAKEWGGTLEPVNHKPQLHTSKTIS